METEQKKVAQGAGNVRSEDKWRVVLGTLGGGGNEQRTDADSDNAPVEAVSPSRIAISDERIAEVLSPTGKITSEEYHENMDCDVSRLGWKNACGPRSGL